MNKKLEAETGNGNRILFFKELYSFNALLDIDIDEENFQRAQNEGALESNLDLITGKLESLSSLFQKLALKESVSGLINAVHEDFVKEDKVPLDVKLHGIWQDFIDKYATIDKNAELNVKRQALRLKGLSLLVMAKYVRALLMSNPLQPNLSDDQDALTRFASANLSHVYAIDDPEEYTYLHRLILLECAACASPEATIGFLNLADSTTPVKDKSEDVYKNFQDEYKEVVPWFDALIAFNKAVAFSHTGRKEKALERAKETIRLSRNLLKNSNSRSSSSQKLLDEELPLYLEIPALHLHAELLNKMQCCKNAVDSLNELYSSLSKVKKEKTTYKIIRALLLEVLCWLDMGDQYQAFLVVKKVLKNCSNDRALLHEIVVNELRKRLLENNGEPMVALEKNDYETILEKKPALHTDAIKLFLQLDLEKWKSNLIDIETANEEMIEKAGGLIRYLKEFIETHCNDRFQRQNLKEIGVDWLELLSKIEKIKEQGKSDVKHPILSKIWRDTIENVLGCLGNEQNDRISPSKRNVDFAYEIWGDDFKYLDPTVVERTKNVLSGLTDECEKFFHGNKHQANKRGQCNHSEEKKLLADLAAFEMKVLGLKREDGTPRHDLVKEKIFPKQGTYEHRRAIRRGKVLLMYHEISRMQDGNCLDDETCFGSTKEVLAWLGQEEWLGKSEEEDDCKGISACLKEFKATWVRGDKRDETVAADRPMLWLEDYQRIISDSDYLKHLEAGRSEQPINIFENNLAGVEFVALRRWNSFTPEISFSKGGGYFLFVPAYQSHKGDENGPGEVYRATRLGIIVDPGFDFIHNFFRQGFTLDDIDIVLITHADSDHINDFSGLADLLRVRKKKQGKSPSKMIYTFLPQNAHRILNRYIIDESFRRLYYDTVLVDASIDSEPEEDKDRKGPDNGTEKGAITSINGPSFSLKLKEEKGNIKLKFIRLGEQDKDPNYTLKVEVHPVPASHNDHAGETTGSFGYVLKFTEKNKGLNSLFATIGFTGDSQWFPEFASNFRECDLVCSHMGNVLGDDPKKYKSDKFTLGDWETLIREENHPYLPGEVLFLEQLRKLGDVKLKRVVVLSEFGEELKGSIRSDICKRFNRCFIGNPEKCDWRNFTYPQSTSNGVEKGAEEEKERCGKCKDQIEGKYIRTIPADVGLRISVRKNMEPLVHCVLCDQYYGLDDTRWISHGGEEAMFYVCGPCFRSKTRDMRIAKYESILELGRPTRRSRTKRERVSDLKDVTKEDGSST